MFVELCEDFANYKAYIISLEEGDYQYWVVAAWHTDSKVTDHNKGDLTVMEFVKGWDGPVKQRGERPATSLERAWLGTLIEIYDYKEDRLMF